jgi:hypothetical protein
MTPLPNARYEWKFRGERLALADVLALVRRHPALFREAYAPRNVNNVYLDTPSRHDYWDHVRGASSRVKTRIRWYGRLNGEDAAPTLERKIRWGTLGGKATYALPALEHGSGFARGALRDTLERAELPDALRAAVCHVEPALANRYRRHYLVSADGRFRLTVDCDLHYYGVHPGSGAFAAWPLVPPEIIVEVKFDPRHAEDAPWVTNHLPLRVTRCSKYVFGIECGLQASARA